MMMYIYFWDLQFKESRGERWSILYKVLWISSDFMLKFGKSKYGYEYLFLRFKIWSLKKIGSEEGKSISCKVFVFSDLMVV